MSIWNKVLIGLIIVAMLPGYYLASRTLKTYSYWGELVNKGEKRIAATEKEKQELIAGSPAGPGIRQLKADLERITFNRPRMWKDCAATVSLRGQSPSAKLTLDADTHGLTEKQAVYAFTQADANEGGAYLGVFKVTKAAKGSKDVTVETAYPLSDAAMKRLKEAKGPWVLYEQLPQDTQDAFAKTANKEENGVEEAAPAEAAKPKEDRPLNDYAFLFDWYRTQDAAYVDRIESGVRDKELLESTLADVKKHVEFYGSEIGSLKKTAQVVSEEDGVISGHLTQLRKTYEGVRKTISDFLTENKAMAGAIAKMQLEAARRVNERTASVMAATEKE